MTRWNNGVPELCYGKAVTPTSVKKLAVISASLPYEGEWDEDLEMFIIEERFKGLSNIEVMWMKVAEKAANGDTTSINILLDRILGKPKQSVESASVTMGYEEFCKMIAEREGKSE